MIDYDTTWRNPPRAQLDALKHACHCLGIKYQEDANHHKNVMLAAQERLLLVEALGTEKSTPMTPYEWAEIMILAHSSLWYSITRGDAEKADHIADQLEARKLKEVVDLGYRDGKWWDWKSIWETPEKQMTCAVLIIDYSFRKYTSAVFSRLPTLLFPKLDARLIFKEPFSPQGKAALNYYFNPAMRKEIASAIPLRDCINPFCTKDHGARSKINPLLKKSGACCKDCINYECTNPECIEKAKANGWTKYTHRWGTKIAQEHSVYAKL